MFCVLFVRLDLLDFLERGERLIDFLLFGYLGRGITYQLQKKRVRVGRGTRLFFVCFHSSGVIRTRPQHGVGTTSCLRATSDAMAPKLTLRFDMAEGAKVGVTVQIGVITEDATQLG